MQYFRKIVNYKFFLSIIFFYSSAIFYKVTQNALFSVVSSFEFNNNLKLKQLMRIKAGQPKMTATCLTRFILDENFYAKLLKAFGSNLEKQLEFYPE